MMGTGKWGGINQYWGIAELPWDGGGERSKPKGRKREEETRETCLGRIGVVRIR